ncbi:MarR family winged helix-turn-helix transcriptional regulator [Fontibacillus sp. BL9]|uniref:MarR family winged helix-turn-helix transcriptional regulator n=1 Tax=Fontibacillus sp. BL9 TaxID=3389971 RepID=UPI00397E58E9
MDQKELIHEIVESFREIKKASYQLLSLQADSIGITGIQYMALKTILRQPGIAMSELAESMRLGNSTVSGVIDRLVKAELVERRRLVSDRRSITLHLTAKGREVEHQTDLKYTESISRVLELPEEEIFQMLETHKKIIDIIIKVREGNQSEQQ